MPQSAGHYWLVVTADANGAVAEYPFPNDNATIADSAINVAPVRLPDLTAQLKQPPDGYSGGLEPIQFQVTNVGQAPTSVPGWHDWVVLTRDPNLGAIYDGSNDNVLDSPHSVKVSMENPEALDVGQGYTQTVDVPLPADAEGIWYAYVIPDGTGAEASPAMLEASRADKLSIPFAFHVQLTPFPALTVTSVTPSPGPPQAGKPLSLTWVVQNDGNGTTATDSWFDGVYLSTQPTLDQAVLLTTVYHPGALAPHAQYKASATVVLPPIGENSRYFFVVKTDVGGVVFQNGDTAGNVGASAAVQVTATPPHLTVDPFTAPSTALTHNPFTFSYSVTNSGPYDTPNSNWKDAFYLSPTSTYDPTTAMSLGMVIHEGSLSRDNQYQNTVTETIPDNLDGSYHVLVKTDADGVVLEPSAFAADKWQASTNTVSISTSRAFLAVTSLSAPAEAMAGTAVQITWTVANHGSGGTVAATWEDNVYADTGLTPGQGKVLLASFVHHGELRPDQSYTSTQQVTFPVSLKGPYNIFVVTNEPPEGQNAPPVEEVSADTNTSNPIPILIEQQLADLQVLFVKAPATAVTGGSVEVDWSVQNTGPVLTDSNYWYDDVWLSTHRTLQSGGADVYVGSRQHSNPLAPGESYAASLVATVPQTTGFVAGNYYFIVACDRPVAPPTDLDGEGVNLVTEGNKQNNQASAAPATAVSLGPTPSLSVSQVNAPGTVASGQTLSVQWTVTNQGSDTGSTPIRDAVYLSYDQVFDPGTARYLGPVAHAGGLAHGGHYQQNASLDLPAGLAGPFFVLVVTNSDHSLLGGSPFASSPLPVTLVLPQPANLVAGSVQAGPSALAGQPLIISYTVTNHGTNPANGFWVDAVYLSATREFTGNAILLKQNRESQNLALGQSYSETLSPIVPGVRPGAYWVLVRTNVLDNYPESTLADNTAVSVGQTVVDAPRLQIGMEAQGKLSTSQAVYYRLDVGLEDAGKTLRVSLNGKATSALNELYASYGTMPTRAEADFRFGGALSSNEQLTIPAAVAGPYYILAYADKTATGPEGYALDSTFVLFSLDGVTPAEVGTGPVTLHVTGALFGSATLFQLQAPGGQTVSPVRPPLIADSANAFVTFDLTGHAPGAYHVLAMQAGSSPVTLPASLSVVPAAPNAVQLNLIVPDVQLIGRPGTITISYANPGNTDLPAPLLSVAAENAQLQVPGQDVYRAKLQLFAFNPSGPFGILPPGFQGSITLPFQPSTAEVNAISQFSLSSLRDSLEPFDWSAVASTDVPQNTSPQQWAGMVQQAAPLVGNTWGAVVSFVGSHSVRLVADAGPNNDATTNAGLYNFDSLLQYVVAVYGSPAPIDPPPPYPTLITLGQVTLYNAHVDQSGKPIQPNVDWPTFLLITDAQGYQDKDGKLAAVLAADAAVSLNGQVNILLATWQSSIAGTPWDAALQVNSAGQALGSLLVGPLGPLVPRPLAAGDLYVIGDGLGSYVGSEAAKIMGGSVASLVALNPASALGGYLPPDLQRSFEQSTAFETSSLYDEQAKIAGSTRLLATNDVVDPLAQHADGLPWLTQQIEQQQIDPRNIAALAGPEGVPAANNPAPPSFPELLSPYLAQVVQIAPHDPNTELNARGVGVNQYVTRTQPLPYEITFTNQKDAKASAQVVKIEQPLDRNVDLGQFRLASFGIAGRQFQVPDNVANYQATLDFIQQLHCDVFVSASVDVVARVATWVFTAIDPTTGQVPLDPTIGVLPPDGTTGVGEGFVTYTIQASRAASTGAVIYGQATVTFDTQPPLNTNLVFNTVDSGAGLASLVTAQPIAGSTNSYKLSWRGTDDENGSAVRGYTIYYSDNGAAPQVYLENTSLTSASFVGEEGHAYKFYSKAEDNAGNVESLALVSTGAPGPPSSGVSAGAPTGGAPPSNGTGRSGLVLDLSVLFTTLLPPTSVVAVESVTPGFSPASAPGFSGIASIPQAGPGGSSGGSTSSIEQIVQGLVDMTRPILGIVADSSWAALDASGELIYPLMRAFGVDVKELFASPEGRDRPDEQLLQQPANELPQEVEVPASAPAIDAACVLGIALLITGASTGQRERQQVRVAWAGARSRQ